MTKVHIVIPVHNNWELTHSLLWNLYKHEKSNIDTVLVVDDASTDVEVTSGLAWWEANPTNSLRVFGKRLPENIGFLHTANSGLRDLQFIQNQDANDLVILLSNDVHVYGGFIDQIKEILKSNVKSLVGGVLYQQDTGWNKFGDKIFPYVEGWLLATTLGNWNELGQFDERYAPNDFEDVDVSTTALLKGYELVALNNPAVVHLGGRTIGYNPERLALTNINKKKFEDKWIK